MKKDYLSTKRSSLYLIIRVKTDVLSIILSTYEENVKKRVLVHIRSKTHASQCLQNEAVECSKALEKSI